MKEKITSNQLYITLFLCSVLCVATLSTESLNGNIWDSMVYVAIAFTINIVLAIPILTLKNKGFDVKTLISQSKLYVLVATFYILYFLLNNIIALAKIQNLFLNTIFPDISPIVLGVLIVATAFYGATKGIESVARSAGIVLVFVIIGLLLMFFGVLNLVNFENREQFFYKGTSYENVLVIFSKASIIPQFAVLSLYTKKGKTQKGFYISQALGAVLLVLLFLLVVLTMGRFSQTQIYPFYTIFTISKLAPLERLDAVFSLIWLMVLVIKLSANLLAMKVMFCKQNKLFLLVFAGLTLLSSLFVVGNSVEVLNSIELWSIPLIIILGTLIPILCLFKVVKN